MTFAEFSSLVRTLLTDHQPSDILFVEAVCEFVRSRAARELRSNEEMSRSHHASYRALRRRLAGFDSPRSEAGLLVEVQKRISDTGFTEAMAVRAIADAVRGAILREVHRDVESYNSFTQSWAQLRWRLLGRTPTISAEDLGAAVRELLPVDAQRLNIQTFIDRQIQAALDEMAGLSAWVGEVVKAARDHIRSLAPRVDAEIKAGLIDLQTFIPGFRQGNRTTYTDAVMAKDGKASRGLLPFGSRPRTAWVIYGPDDDGACKRAEVTLVPEREIESKLVCGGGCEALLGFEKAGRFFYVTPQLVDGVITLLLVWDGMKTEWTNSEEVFYTRQVAEAVAAWVDAKLTVEADEPASQAQLYAALYRTKRLHLWRADRAGKQLSDHAS